MVLLFAIHIDQSDSSSVGDRGTGIRSFILGRLIVCVSGMASSYWPGVMPELGKTLACNATFGCPVQLSALGMRSLMIRGWHYLPRAHSRGGGQRSSHHPSRPGSPLGEDPAHQPQSFRHPNSSCKVPLCEIRTGCTLAPWVGHSSGLCLIARFGFRG